MSQNANQNHRSDLMVGQLREQIEDQLAFLPRGTTIRRGKAIELALTHGAEGLTIDKLNRMIKLGLVRPNREDRGGRVLLEFSRDDIRDIVLIQKLRQGCTETEGEKNSYAWIASHLQDQTKSYQGPQSEGEMPQTDVFLPTQVKRGLVYLRSRTLGMCLTWLFRGRIPVGALVIVRRREYKGQQLPAGTASYQYELEEFVDIDGCLGDIRASDLVCHVSPEGELLHHEITNLNPFSSRQWHHWRVDCGSPRRQFDFVVAVSPASLASDCLGGLLDSETALLFASLLEVCFLHEKALQPSNAVEDTNPDFTTPLQAILYVLPELSPIWQYCAVFLPDLHDPSHLRLAATSPHFPAELRRDLSIQAGQLLTGWAYQFGYPVTVLQTTGIADPRLAHQDEERATAAIALPTRVANEPNGVLYVGTRASLDADTPAFSDAEIRLLRMVADILGEIAERNRIRVNGERMALRVIQEPTRHTRPWIEYKAEVQSAIQQALMDEQPHETSNILHVTALRLEGYALMAENNIQVAHWAADHIRDVTHRFFLEHLGVAPSMFDRYERNPAEFVCLVPSIHLTDEEDRIFRDKLRRVLSSLRVSFRVHEPTQVHCYVWSMPFRLAGLRKQVKQRDLRDGLRHVVGKTVRETQDALMVLPFIEKGHRYEEQGSSPQALDQYSRAHDLVPENLYIMRHVAKSLTSMGDYRGAVHWWRRVTAAHKHPSHYRRLGHVLACLGEFEAAIACYETALTMNAKDSTCYSEWADILMLQGKTSEAIKKYRQAQLYDEDNADFYLARIAEAHFEQKTYRDAQNFVNLLLVRDPENQNAKRLTLQVLQHSEPKLLGEGLETEVVEGILEECQTLVSQ